MLFLKTLFVSLLSVGQRIIRPNLDGLFDLAEKGEAPPACYITVA